MIHFLFFENYARGRSLFSPSITATKQAKEDWHFVAYKMGLRAGVRVPVFGERIIAKLT